MKKIFLYTISCLSLLLFFSCSYEDLSTNEIVSAEIIIDTTGIPVTHTINALDVLKISPKVSKAGTSGDNFKYEWILSLLPNNNENTVVISTERELNVPIVLEADAEPYRLWYIVTDTITMLQKDIVWEVEVSASSGKGIVVAYSRDGINSDFDVVQSDQFSPQSANPDYVSGQELQFKIQKRSLYSKANGENFKGIVNGTFFLKEVKSNRNMNFIFAYTDHSIERINTLDYSFDMNEKEMFFNRELSIQPEYMNLANGEPFYVGGGRVYQRLSSRMGKAPEKFSIDVSGNYVANKYISLVPNGGFNGIAFFDEVNLRFYSIKAYPTIPWWPEECEVLGDAGSPFKPDNLKGFKVIGAGHYDADIQHRFILKHDENRYIFTVSSEEWTTLEVYDITSATKIKDAMDYIICPNQDVVYYRVGNEVYAIVLGGDTPKYELKYTSSEPIVKMQMYYDVSNKMSTSNKLLLISTYSGSEGKIYTLPLINLGTGNIDQANIRIYDGFGKISSIGTQN